MAKLTALPELSIISGLKKTIDFYVWKGIPVARAWPRSPGRARSPSVMQQWPIFATASTLWAQLTPQLQDAYKHMAVGLPLTGRDLFIKGYIKSEWLHLT